MERKGTRFGASARSGNWSAKPPIRAADAKMKNVFVLLGESDAGRRWIETAYANQDRAKKACEVKNELASAGTKYTYLHVPVND